MKSKTYKHKVCNLPESLRKDMKGTPSMKDLFITDAHDVGGMLVDIAMRDVENEEELLDVITSNSEERTDDLSNNKET